MSGAIIRPARSEDLPAIAALLADDGLGRGRESTDMGVYHAAFQRMEGQPGNIYLVAVVDGDVAGCLQYTVIHGLSRSGASRAQIEGVRVAASARGQRIGETMMNAAMDRARADEKRFYERLGFVASHFGMKLAL